MKRIFAGFQKVQKNEDGTLTVTGIASTETEDSDGEIVKAEAMRAALPDYMTFGAVREMHQPIAAGTAIKANVNDDGVTEFSCLVVDPVSVKKVETGVLKGFSIGGKITKRSADSKNVITGLKLVEISLVDRPANPDAKILLVKMDSEGRVIERGATLKKGMYDVSRLADLICSLSYLTQGVQQEAVYEGDSSAMGGRLHTACESLVGILKDLLDEEAAEMLGITSGSIAAAAKVAEKHASGSRYTIDQITSQLAELRKAATSPGATTMDDKEKAAAAEELSKATKRATDAEAKLATAESEKAEALAKATRLEGELTTEKAAHATTTASLKKAEGERDSLMAESKKLVESLSAKGHLRVVPKGADTGSQPEETPAQKAERERKEKDPVELVKQSFAKPIIVGGKPATDNSGAK